MQYLNGLMDLDEKNKKLNFYKKKRSNIIMVRTIKKISNAYGYKSKLSKTLLGYSGAFGGGRPQQTQKSVGRPRPVGRPRGEFKHRDPKTGQPIPATIYYKRLKELRRQAQQQARLKDIQQIQQLAKRGIPPEQAQQIVDARQLRREGVTTQPNQPTQITPEMQRRLLQQQQLQAQQIKLQSQNGQIVPPETPTIWRGRRGVVGQEGTVAGQVKKVYGLPSSFWN